MALILTLVAALTLTSTLTLALTPTRSTGPSPDKPRPKPLQPQLSRQAAAGGLEPGVQAAGAEEAGARCQAWLAGEALLGETVGTSSAPPAAGNTRAAGRGTVAGEEAAGGAPGSAAQWRAQEVALHLDLQVDLQEERPAVGSGQERGAFRDEVSEVRPFSCVECGLTT